jgi:hypothetical protein
MPSLLATNPLFAELSLRGWFPGWVAVLLGVAAVATAGVLYAREAGRIAVLPRVLMACVRMGILIAVAFLLLRPVWVNEDRGDRRRPIAVLVDVSESMGSKDPRPSTADQWRVALAFNLVEPGRASLDTPVTAALSGSLPDRPKRIEVAREALTNPKFNLLSRLGSSAGPVEPATFGSQRTGRDPVDQKWLRELDAIKPEPRTAMVDAAMELLARDRNDMPAAIVLVTDGRENASSKSLDDLAREAARHKVPISVYGVGSSSYGQLQLRDVAAPETLFVNDLVAVPVRYRVRSVPEGRVKIVLMFGDREVASKEVAARDGDDLKETLTFVPTKADADAQKQELTAKIKITTPAGEVLEDELTRGVKVVDKKLKVLVVDSLPRWDFKYLQRGLLRDRRVEAKFFLSEADRQAMRAGDRSPWLAGFPTGRDDFRKELFEYDLLILGDVPGKFFNAEQQEVIKQFVSEGGGLVQIAGRVHAPSEWVSGWTKTPTLSTSPIADVLPVEFEPRKFPTESPGRPTPFRPVPVQSVIKNPVISLEDDPLDNARLWRTLPEIYWHYPVTRLKPAAEAFLVHPREQTADKKPMPLLAGHYYGKGYVLFVGFDETWRWRFNEADKYFGRFWSQAVYVAGVPRTVGTKLTQLSLDTPDPVKDKTGQVYARLFTRDFQPLTAERIEARLVKVDADPNDKDANVPVELRPLPGQPGEYVAALPFNQIGRFALRVDPGNDNPATLDYRVTLPPEHEQAPGGMAEADMRKLAEATGGKFYREENLHELPDDVRSQLAPYTRRTETILWNGWAMALLIGLLTLEWVLRKFNSLS